MRTLESGQTIEDLRAIAERDFLESKKGVATSASTLAGLAGTAFIGNRVLGDQLRGAIEEAPRRFQDLQAASKARDALLETKVSPYFGEDVMRRHGLSTTMNAQELSAIERPKFFSDVKRMAQANPQYNTQVSPLRQLLSHGIPDAQARVNALRAPLIPAKDLLRKAPIVLAPLAASFYINKRIKDRYNRRIMNEFPP